MSQSVETPEVAPTVEEKGSRGCLYGCLALFAVVVGMFICGGVGLYFLLTSQVQKYTAETPTEMPAVEFSGEQLTELKARLDTFKEALDEELPSDDLVLTADEINALINDNDDLKGRAFVEIKDGRVGGEISIPTDKIPGGQGRFFNASAKFDVELRSGVLIVTLADATVKGEQVPQEVIEGMSKENLAKDLYKDPKNAEMISRFESIEIVDDTIILRLRRDKAADDSADSPDGSDESSEESDANTEGTEDAEPQGDVEEASADPPSNEGSESSPNPEGDSDAEPEGGKAAEVDGAEEETVGAGEAS